MIELNLKNRAAAQSTIAFNSMCRMSDGTLLGANGNGVFKMCGYTDNGTAIPVLLKSGMLDMGTHHLKRFRFFYFGLEATGDLSLSVFCDGDLAASYTINIAESGVQSVRVPISREHQGRYWQWQVENTGGAFFALYSVKALPIMIGGRQRQ